MENYTSIYKNNKRFIEREQMMTDKEQIDKVFFKTLIFKVIFLIVEMTMLYALVQEEIMLCLRCLCVGLVLLITLFINLWDTINEERLGHDR